MKKKILFIFIFTVFIGLMLNAGTTGQLAGKVRDEQGRPAPANIILEGTQIGAAAKDNGQYIIINIPPGTYNVKCLSMGFGTQLVEGVKIGIDETTTLNFTLSKDALALEGVTIIEAKNQGVKRDRSGSSSTVTSDTIEEIAAESIEDIVAIQAGAVNTGGELHVRGGRANEVVYTVDGMSVSDPVDGGSALTLDQDAIADMSVMTGGFTAEYGNAQSGIVNIVTKSGGENYSGKLEINTDHLLGLKELTFDLLSEKLNFDNPSNEDELKFALGGPVLGDLGPNLRNDLTFFLNGAIKFTDGRYRDYYSTDPNDDIPNLSGEWSSYNPYHDENWLMDFDDIVLDERNYNYYNANLKVKYQLNPRQNITFAMRGDTSNSTPYSHAWRYALEHYLEYEQLQNQYIVTYDHMFNSQMNLKIKGSYYQKSYTLQPKDIDRDDYYTMMDSSEWDIYYMDSNGRNTSGIYFLDENGNGVIGEGEVYNWQYFSDGNEYPVGSFVTPGAIYGTYQDDSSEQMTLRTDFEYQVNTIHGFKSGFELIKHHIEKDRLYNPWIIDPYRYDEYLASRIAIEHYDAGDSLDTNGDGIMDLELSEDTDFYSQQDNFDAIVAASGTTDGYRADPWQAAYYLQDKMEWEGMIVNAGVRLDFWYLGESYEILKEDGSYRERDFDNDEKFQMMVSPRLGVSHPIVEGSVLHFAYNYQNQLPQMQYIFTTVDSTDAYTSDSNVVVGNPSLEPQITVTYEVGLQQQLTEDIMMDLTAYYKNIYNYVSTRKVEKEGDETVYWYEYYSEDYGSAKGIDLNLSKQLSNFISGSASYSLSWANGNNSSTVVQDETTNLREFPLDWDTRHNFNFNMGFRIQNDEEFYLPFINVRVPFDDFSMNFLYNIASGSPYTGVNDEDTSDDINSSNKPYTSNANLTIYKKFSFSKKSSVKFYLTISNLFDKINYYGVFPRTGRPNDDGLYEPNPNGDGYIDDNGDYVSEETYLIHQMGIDDPSRASEGRTYSIGFTFNW
ncbi:MAG: carboxypeptidase regulatory-like domain-containing protein [Candidatus Stygibacter australis]|nr:carboxypeptidase regulatory-like domain-containing protein [Candidatus Stygibacter australis]